jgi:hypothetical protein
METRIIYAHENVPENAKGYFEQLTELKKLYAETEALIGDIKVAHVETMNKVDLVRGVEDFLNGVDDESLSITLHEATRIHSTKRILNQLNAVSYDLLDAIVRCLRHMEAVEHEGSRGLLYYNADVYIKDARRDLDEIREDWKVVTDEWEQFIQQRPDAYKATPVIEVEPTNHLDYEKVSDTPSVDTDVPSFRARWIVKNGSVDRVE